MAVLDWLVLADRRSGSDWSGEGWKKAIWRIVGVIRKDDEMLSLVNEM